jgi:signal transduction histidine kinase
LGLPEAPKRSGGLSNMMWRAAELGGSCTVERNEPAGTRLVWHVPV